eukprot:CAMPEP_0178531714 /NCGR_PEP_ID=MMETSP0696-20121128/33580_1 /TAXON_ID=265572 /ORGANISM="Extubocellulus spinifer, Strain CCMP396" /LENGTH=505 /DNA_ID=CAMNT_0020163647 /DNA_START=78 /DNA_END=1595 /DNA_ORIENTATION=+
MVVATSIMPTIGNPSTTCTACASSSDDFVENPNQRDDGLHQTGVTRRQRRLLAIGAGVALVGFAAAAAAAALVVFKNTGAISVNEAGAEAEGGRKQMPIFRHRRIRERHKHKHNHKDREQQQQQQKEEKDEEVLFEEEWSQYHSPLGEDLASTDGSAADAAVRQDAVTPCPEVPPLSELVQEEEVHGDISWMVDFAIIGNPKCGTTFLMHWLSRPDDTAVYNGELCSLSHEKPHEVAGTFYDQVTDSGRIALTNEGHRIKGGLKCPKEISTERGLENWSRFFPETKFIISTRHPVEWFQSFYNYHAVGKWPEPVPHPNDLIGACYDESPYLCIDDCEPEERPGNSKLCTDRANFHHSLSRLGKTPMNTPEELQLLDHDMSIVPQKGKVFLMESSQLIPENPSSEYLAEDISRFLDLKYDLRPLKDREGYGPESHQYKHAGDARHAFIDICDDEFEPVREVLVQQGKEASLWIKNYFLKSEDVVVSSPRRFVKLLDKWSVDPCRKE